MSKMPAPFLNVRDAARGQCAVMRAPRAHAARRRSPSPRSGSSPSAQSSRAAVRAPIVAAAAMRASAPTTPRATSASAIASSVAALLRAIAPRSDGVRDTMRSRSRTSALAGAAPSASPRPSPPIAAAMARRGRLPGDRLRDQRVVGILDEYRVLRWEVAEERHLRHPGTFRDRRRSCRVVAALVEQLQRGPKQSGARSFRLVTPLC